MKKKVKILIILECIALLALVSLLVLKVKQINAQKEIASGNASNEEAKEPPREITESEILLEKTVLEGIWQDDEGHTFSFLDDLYYGYLNKKNPNVVASYTVKYVDDKLCIVITYEGNEYYYFYNFEVYDNGDKCVFTTYDGKESYETIKQ